MKKHIIFICQLWKYLESDEKDPYKRGIKFEKFVKKY